MKKAMHLIICTCTVGLSYGQYWNTTPNINGNGVIEVGKYLDFHESSNDANDYSVRLYSDNSILKITSSLYVKGLNLDGSSLSYLRNTGDLLIGWNRSGGMGETNFIANRGGGSQGGFDFRDVDNLGNEVQLMKIKGDGIVGIGTNNPTNRLTIAGAELNDPSLLIRNTSYGSTNSTGTVSMQFAFSNHLGPTIEATKFSVNTTGLNFYTEYGFNIRQLGMTIKPTSNGSLVGIGTTAPDAKLTVKGNIHAEEVKVDLNVPAPDYVFKEGYDLKSLEDVQNYIQKHGHLPNIPSALEMEKNGVELGELNMKLLEKIEELTLYIIELKKEIILLKTQRQ